MYKMATHKEVVIEAHENYQKRSFRNRIYLSGPPGRSHFTIPLAKGKHEKQDIRDVVIAYDENWINQLERILKTSYGSAPFYIYYAEEVLALFKKKPRYLYALNTSLLEWVIQTLALDIRIMDTSTYLPGTSIPDEMTDARGTFLPKHMDTAHPIIKYRQVYEDKNGFIPNLSILDMLMCCGPEIPLYFADKKLKL